MSSLLLTGRSFLKLSAVLMFAAVMSGVQAHAQTGATVQGMVNDLHGKPVGDAVVELKDSHNSVVLQTRSDSHGSYHFSSVAQGTYSLHAGVPENGKINDIRLTVGAAETRTVNLTIGNAGSALSDTQFFDNPQFTVAGVTSTGNMGGHASDNVVRTTDALAKATASLGKNSAGATATTSEKALREAIERNPEDAKANRDLGILLLDSGRAQEAMPYLQRASARTPSDFAVSYGLARAYCAIGDFDRAHAGAESLVRRPDLAPAQAADVHHLLGDIEERRSNSLAAVLEYQEAAKLDPSEGNVFDWGTELLAHRGIEPAIQVFDQGRRRFPASVRMRLGLSAALYAKGSYDEAARHAFQASDLNPDNPAPYLFLGRMQITETAESDGIAQRLQRFLRLQPGNPMANYYYAVSIWRRGKGSLTKADYARSIELLEKAVRLDPGLSPAYSQLGVLFSERGDLEQAIAATLKAAETGPGLPDPHYRLAQLYRRVGDNAKSEDELQLYKELFKKDSEAKQREHRDLQQFVISMRDQPTAR